MKRHPAIAVLEFAEIAVGIVATDSMLKKAPIALLRSGTITHGRFLTLIGGSTASVEESLQEGLFWGAGSVLDHVLLPDVHAELYAAILGARQAATAGALAILETDTVSANVRAAEAALKGTPVRLLEIRLADAGLSGKGVSFYQGELHDIEAAVTLAVAAVHAASHEIASKIIPAPHEALARQLQSGTAFPQATLLELDGEKA